MISFQSTSPYAGDDVNGFTVLVFSTLFQSTSPYAGDDIPKSMRPCHIINFNPRPPHGGRRFTVIFRYLQSNFNPRPPHGGRQYLCASSRCFGDNFNPHPPMRGMTQRVREGHRPNYNFNPHPPMRGMTSKTRRKSFIELFQSTSPYAGDDFCELVARV